MLCLLVDVNNVHPLVQKGPRGLLCPHTLLFYLFYFCFYSILGLHEVDLDDMTSARQLLLKRSVMSDVKEKLVEATRNQWEDWLEFSLFQAEQLGLDYHEEQEVCK